jgi:hypothetical protein
VTPLKLDVTSAQQIQRRPGRSTSSRCSSTTPVSRSMTT